MTTHTTVVILNNVLEKLTRRGQSQETHASYTKTNDLMIEPSDHPQCQVESSYSVHPDMKSHSGTCMKLENYLTQKVQRSRTRSNK